MIKSTYDSVGAFNYKKIKKEKLKMDIEFIRGDTQYIKFQLKDGSGNPIQLEDDEKIYFTVKQNSNSKKVLLQKKFPADISFADGYYQFELSLTFLLHFLHEHKKEAFHKKIFPSSLLEVDLK